MHRAGIKNQAAEALSQLAADGKDETELNYALPVRTIVPGNKPKEVE